MIKAVFVDYTGTTVREGGSEMKEAVKRICVNSDVHDPVKIMELWWGMVKKYENESYLDTYMTEDEIVDASLNHMAEQIHLRENLAELHTLIQGFWLHAPAFPDAAEFFTKCPLPIYVITNNGTQYVSKSLEEKGISAAGIICADEVRAYKPHRELFEKALEVSGCSREEVVHIGDSYTSDVQGARAAGIRPILVQRKSDKTYEDVTVVKNLMEVLQYIS